MWVNVRVEWQSKPQRTPIIVTPGCRAFNLYRFLNCWEQKSESCHDDVAAHKHGVGFVCVKSYSHHVVRGLILRNGPEWTSVPFFTTWCLKQTALLVSEAEQGPLSCTCWTAWQDQPAANQDNYQRAEPKLSRVSSLNYELERNSSAFCR